MLRTLLRAILTAHRGYRGFDTSYSLKGRRALQREGEVVRLCENRYRLTPGFGGPYQKANFVAFFAAFYAFQRIKKQSNTLIYNGK